MLTNILKNKEIQVLKKQELKEINGNGGVDWWAFCRYPSNSMHPCCGTNPSALMCG
ncbi:hypothetical protein T190115A13A_210056 [Tenacibaculum sp. 190524A02b]|uniref:Uncharacterized protein n=1 Tax=Tenacibaculum vairaonense TaxID=3137860 RepID=A0ABP1F7V6_9FLAO